jgi:fumarate reductase subunit D
MSKSTEPIWWSLFAAGGVVAALFIPVFIIITGVILPFTLTGEEPFLFERIHGGVSNPVIRLLIFCLVVFPLFHFAHRFRSILVDIGLLGIRPMISVLCYGSAIIGTIIAAIVLWNFS